MRENTKYGVFTLRPVHKKRTRYASVDLALSCRGWDGVSRCVIGKILKSFSTTTAGNAMADETDADKRPLPFSHRPKKKSGSEKRRTDKRLNMRLSDGDYERAAIAARKAGLTLASYGRLRLVDAPETQTRRLPLADGGYRSRLVGELGRVGNNMNQIARHINQGQATLAEVYEDAVYWMREVKRLMREALEL